MTVCIGTICVIPNLGRGIVLCSDTRAVVPGSTFSDKTWKREVLGESIMALLCGQLSCGRELASIYRAYLADKESQLTRDNILDHLREPPRRLKRKLIEEYFMLNWAISYQDFLNGALSALRESELLKIGTDINNIGFPDSTYMLIGSLAAKDPSLFVVYPDGRVFEEENFAVIGSGYAVARASLCRREYHGYWPLSHALYAVYEAKKLSEGDPNVGPDTVIAVSYLDQNKKHRWHQLADADHDALAKDLARLGPQRLSAIELPPSIKGMPVGDMVDVHEQKALPESTSSGGGQDPQE